MRAGGTLLTVLAISGTPMLALIVLLATGAATPLGAAIAIGLTLLVAGALALVWTRDLTVLSETVRRLDEDQPIAETPALPGLERVGRELNGFVRLRDGLSRIGILERDLGEELVRGHEFGIEFERFRGPDDRVVVVAVFADEREAEIGLRILRIPLQRFLEEALGVGVVEALVEEESPADTIERVAVGLGHGCAEFIVRVRVISEAPTAFRAEVGIARACERFVASLRIGAMPVLA